jgi:hypothetical protein
MITVPIDQALAVILLENYSTAFYKRVENIARGSVKFTPN